MRHLLRFLRDVTTGPDDLMALAEATAEPLPANGSDHVEPIHPALRCVLSDDNLRAVLTEWEHLA